jgi:hypothetical protein
MLFMNPYAIRAADTTVEVWSGYRVQYKDQERHSWQKVLKAELKQVFRNLAIPCPHARAG